MPTASPDQLERWRAASNRRYALHSADILAAHHDRGIPCRECWEPRAVAAKDRERVVAAGGPLCFRCRREAREARAARRPTPKVCDQCGGETYRGKNQNGRFCLACHTARENDRKRGLHHRRRAQGGQCDMTMAVERAMRDAVSVCPLCGCGLTDDWQRPTSKELDHVVPLGVGGTHTRANTRVICRRCNLRRPKDGSDYAGPVTFDMVFLPVAEAIAASVAAA